MPTFVKYDNKGQVSEAAAAARKALLDGVTVVTLGGASSNVFGFAVADVTDAEKVLYSTFLNAPELFSDYHWVVCSFYDVKARAKMTAELLVNKLKAKTISILCLETETDRKVMAIIKEEIKALDPEVDFVSEDYTSAGLNDFSSLLTKIRYKNPDAVVSLLVESNYINISKQILEVGGWGDIQFVGNSEAANFKGIDQSPGAKGWYVPAVYLNGQGSPAQIEFGEMWAKKCAEDSAWCKRYSPTGPAPLPNYAPIYNPLLTAIKAVEKAGTDDRGKVAEAALGLEYDSVLGPLKIGLDGKSSISGYFIQWLDGKPVPIELGK
ncbi:MAG: ABC transporter substrate-binding protein [Dehalococcoidia bacterium]|nr:ABC transporter substrate-binding protein [Dehalococcoidia bacterium]